MSLEVNIEKKLDGFTLRAAFSPLRYIFSILRRSVIVSCLNILPMVLAPTLHFCVRSIP